MGIKHKAVKASDEKGYAIEWNDEHIVDSDINFNNFSGINVGEPINASDIATKNYVDTVSLDAIASQEWDTAGGQGLGAIWTDVTGANITVTTSAKDILLISFSVSAYDNYDTQGFFARVDEGGIAIAGTTFYTGNGGGGDPANIALTFPYVPGAKTETYKLQAKVDGSGAITASSFSIVKLKTA